jgi:uncharacterized protein YukE
MAQIGATIEEMHQLQSTFSCEATAVSGQVGNTWWVGPAAERFKSQWEGESRPMLAQLQNALQECSAEVQRRSQAIQEAGS